MTLQTMRTFLGPSFEHRADFLRALMLVCMIRPSASFLGGIFMKPMAFLMALPLTLLTPQGRRAIRWFADDYDRSWFGGLRMAMRSHMNKLKEFGDLQRIIKGQVNAQRFTYSLDASDEVRRLIDSGQSLVVTSAHFVRGVGMGVVLAQDVLKRPIHMVAARPPTIATDAYRWRVQIQLSQALNAARAVRSDLKFVFTGGAFSSLINDLKDQRAMAYINIDAPWSSHRASSYARPFAGAATRTFSTGAAKLSRLTGSPLLFLMPVREPGNHVRVRVLGPFTSAETDPDRHDTDLTHQVLDYVEREVGRRPAEYILDIGGARRWDAARETWVARNG
jgi:lauroyl/myristoyl acyltransferase